MVEFRKSFAIFDLTVKYNIGLKTLLQEGISEAVSYGDFVYKFIKLLESLILLSNSKR